MRIRNLLALLLLVVAMIGAPVASAQVKLAVVDVEKALADFKKTQQEVDRINAYATEKRANIDNRNADYQALTSKMVKLDNTVRNEANPEAMRLEAQKELDGLAQARVAKAREIEDATRRADQELLLMRQDMEKMLMKEVNAVVDQIGQEEGVDMIFDKSFLPQSRKNILFTSSKIIDLTDRVIAKLNAG